MLLKIILVVIILFELIIVIIIIPVKYHIQIPDIECVQLTEPGRVNIICQTRVVLNRDSPPLCLFDEHTVNVLCKHVHEINKLCVQSFNFILILTFIYMYR